MSNALRSCRAFMAFKRCLTQPGMIRVNKGAPILGQPSRVNMELDYKKKGKATVSVCFDFGYNSADRAFKAAPAGELYVKVQLPMHLKHKWVCWVSCTRHLHDIIF